MLARQCAQAEEAGEEAVEAVEQAAQEAGKDPSRFAALRQSGQALSSGLLSLDDNAKLGIEVLCSTSLMSLSILPTDTERPGMNGM
jgi:hypothetical protein